MLERWEHTTGPKWSAGDFVSWLALFVLGGEGWGWNTGAPVKYWTSGNPSHGCQLIFGACCQRYRNLLPDRCQKCQIIIPSKPTQTSMYTWLEGFRMLKFFFQLNVTIYITQLISDQRRMQEFAKGRTGVSPSFPFPSPLPHLSLSLPL